MNKIHLEAVNIGNFAKDKPFYERLKTFNNAKIEITDNFIKIICKNGDVFSSKLVKVEKDSLTITYEGKYEDGTPFRLVKQISNNKWFSIGDLTGDGYAVYFNIVDLSEPDNEVFSESQDTEFISATSSKAETLIIAADSIYKSLPEMAKNYINRFINLLNENEIEIIKFKYIQNIIYGYVLGTRLSIIDEDKANSQIGSLKINFVSNSHLRYENKIMVSGPHIGAKRLIEIKPNFKQKEGYLVTIYNLVGKHPFWGDNIQMATKQMKIISKSNDEITLRGFGYDDYGFPLKNYGLKIIIKENNIQEISLLLYDRSIEIKYLN